MENLASLQKLNLELTNLQEEEDRVKALQIKLKKSLETIGIGFNEQEIESLPSMDFDKKLNKIVTPNGIIQ